MIKPSITALDAARWLMILLLVAVLFSPPVVNLAQALLVILFISSRELRNRIIQACRQPMVIGVLAFYLVVCIGVLYSIADSHATLKMWGGWRKLLLLPLAVALFDNVAWKLRLLKTFLGVTILCVLASYAGLLSGFHFPVSGGTELGVVARNHSTQGMIFATAAFAATALAIYLRTFTPKIGVLVASCALLAASNVIFITTGRSGYVVLIVCGLSLAASWPLSGRLLTVKYIGICITGLAILFSLLALAPSSRQHIMQGIEQSEKHGEENSEISSETQQAAMAGNSIGTRLLFWKHTIPMITKQPLFGYGTGAFYTAYKQHVASLTGADGLATGDPHNQFMKIAGEHGLIGLAVFLAFLISAFKQRPSMPYRLLGLGVLAAWCATSLANSHFSTFNEGVFIYVWLGVMLADEHGNGRLVQHPS